MPSMSYSILFLMIKSCSHDDMLDTNVSKYQKMHKIFTMEPDQITVGGDMGKLGTDQPSGKKLCELFRSRWLG